MSASVRRIEDGIELRGQRLRGERQSVAQAVQEPYLSKQDIADFYAVSKATIDLWCRKGMPFAVRQGRRRFRVSECEAWHTTR